MIQLNFNQLPLEVLGETIVTIGNFDGVHRGHQELIKRAVNDARRNDMNSVVVTFDPHPATYFQPDCVPPAICSKKYKQKLIALLGIDAMLTLTFNAALANLNAEEYVEKILLQKLNAKIIWVGYDFTFGRNRMGNPRLLLELSEKYDFHANVLSPQQDQDIVISSTKIRELILAGNVEQAAVLLNRKHLIQGDVVAGDGRGREIGFPTINLNVQQGLIPASGIYSGIALVKGVEYPAAIYLGNRPSYPSSDFRVEAHLIGFSGDLYGAWVSIAFLKYIRNHIKFDNLDRLKHKIDSDCKVALSDFYRYKANKDIPIFWGTEI